MAQLDPSRYRRLTAPYGYASSDGLYYDTTGSSLVLALGGTIVDVITASGRTGDLEISSETRGDLLRRGASAWERYAIGTSGKVLQSDGTDPVWGLVLAANLDPTLTKYVKVPVSSAELLAINATPKTIVAAPGAGYTTIIHRALLVLNYNSAAYANNGILGLYETDAAGTLLTGTLTLASFLAQTADTQKELHPTAASATTGLTRLDNKAVVLTQATGESISGDSPVDVHCWYSTVPNGL
jgi:hypothetical protein